MRLRPRFSRGRSRVLEPDEGKLSSPVLRGLAPSNGGGLLGKNANGLTCWKRFGVPALFAISGMNNADSARCAIQKSPGSQAGAFITASHVRWVVPLVPRTVFYFIPSAMTGFIVSVFPFRNRVSFQEAFEGLELGERKLSRPVLRGPGGRKVAWLLGNYRAGSLFSRDRNLVFHAGSYSTLVKPGSSLFYM